VQYWKNEAINLMQLGAGERSKILRISSLSWRLKFGDTKPQSHHHREIKKTLQTGILSVAKYYIAIQGQGFTD